MNKMMLRLLFAVGVSSCPLYADNEVLSVFKDASIECDYLIVTIQDFEKPAIALAQLRNSYKSDNVEHAKVAFLSQILSEFPGYEYNQRNIALWRALKWAKENWKIRLHYIVLMGNEGFTITTNNTYPESYSVASTGAIPTWYMDTTAPAINNETSKFPEEITDDLYVKLSTADPPTSDWYAPFDTNLAIGRIPAATAQQCSLYVDKIKRYELSRPKGAWRNSVLAIADDAMQGALNDPYGSDHQTSADTIARSFLQGYSVTKDYLSAFPVDEFYEKPSAKDAIFATVNRGVSWAYFFGHGNDQKLTDENVVTSESIDRIGNDSMPFVFFALTSRNGSFLASTPSSMCLKYLFSQKGGAIAYIASPSETYGEPNKELGISFFAELKKDPAGSLGELVYRAKSKLNSGGSAVYYLLGDPALRVSAGVLPVKALFIADTNSPRIQLSLQGISSDVHFSVSFTVRDSVIPAQAPQGGPDMAFMAFSRDSVVTVASGVFHDSAIIGVPTGLKAPIKAIVYVWNDSADGRAELMCVNGAANPVLGMPSRSAASVSSRPTIRKIRDGLIVSGLEAGNYRIMIFDVRGRSVHSGEIKVGAGSLSIDLAGKNLRAGKYILRIAGRAKETILPFVYMAGN